VAFSVSVYRLADREFLSSPPPVASPGFAAWEEEASRRLIFDAALGGDGDVHRYWSSPAAKAGLPLIASIYEQGLVIEGADLDRLNNELTALDTAWSKEVDPAATRRFICLGHEGEVPLAYELVFRRAESLRSAIRVARAVDGYVVIS
jgi:hypothetical protein